MESVQSLSTDRLESIRSSFSIDEYALDEIIVTVGTEPWSDLEEEEE